MLAHDVQSRSSRRSDVTRNYLTQEQTLEKGKLFCAVHLHVVFRIHVSAHFEKLCCWADNVTGAGVFVATLSFTAQGRYRSRQAFTHCVLLFEPMKVCGRCKLVPVGADTFGVRDCGFDPRRSISDVSIAPCKTSTAVRGYWQYCSIDFS